MGNTTNPGWKKTLPQIKLGKNTIWSPMGKREKKLCSMLTEKGVQKEHRRTGATRGKRGGAE